MAALGIVEYNIGSLGESIAGIKYSNTRLDD